MSCAAIDNQGNNACLFSQFGQPCGNGSPDCATPYACIGGTCGIAQNGPHCVASSTSCAIGDDCSQFANNPSGNDPCMISGYGCARVGINDAGTAYIGACIQPFVVDPANGFPLQYWPCNSADNQCGPLDYSSQSTASTCASFWGANSGHPVCMQSCQTSSDCASVVENCVNGACVPVYCWADDQAAPGAVAYYNSLQGAGTVSGDSSVLFQPCQNIGGAPSYCLPQFDNLLNAGSGLCIRVGGPDAGGLGAACNGNLYGNDPSALCAPGFLCDQGTCLQWCDLDDPFVSSCTGNDTCIVNHSLPISVNRTVARAAGVCAQQCDPYNPPPAAGNGCDAITSLAACTAQGPVCKLTGEDSNLSPPAGLCLNGIANPIAVGSICNPVEAWPDPCVSGAACIPEADGGSYVCTQLCDVHPSHGAQPSCQSPQKCVALACQNSNGTNVCTHKGICQ
jgi:hypothetical protein